MPRAFLLLVLAPAAGAISLNLAVPENAVAGRCHPTILSQTKPNSLKLLLVGNGITKGLGPALEEMAKETGIWSSVEVQVNAQTNYTLKDHMDIAKQNDTYLPRGFNAVIFQEQSQIPGFYDWNREKGGHEQWNEALQSIAYFAELTKKAGMEMGLLQNWGYETGDVGNSVIFPTYAEMQNLLTKGGRILEASSQDKALDGRVHIVPVGEVFRRVHSRDPKGDFHKLYLMDQVPGASKYLSDAGNSLAAAVILRSLTGSRPNVTATGLEARLLEYVPDGPGPCDGNPNFFDQQSAGLSGAAALKIGSLALVSAICAVLHA